MTKQESESCSQLWIILLLPQCSKNAVNDFSGCFPPLLIYPQHSPGKSAGTNNCSPTLNELCAGVNIFLVGYFQFQSIKAELQIHLHKDLLHYVRMVRMLNVASCFNEAASVGSAAAFQKACENKSESEMANMCTSSNNTYLQILKKKKKKHITPLLMLAHMLRYTENYLIYTDNNWYVNLTHIFFMSYSLFFFKSCLSEDKKWGSFNKQARCFGFEGLCSLKDPHCSRVQGLRQANQNLLANKVRKHVIPEKCWTSSSAKH